jgi:hypothetical protein
MVKKLFALAITNCSLLSGAFALDDSAICERIARLEDNGELSNRNIHLSHDEIQHIDLNGDGMLEAVKLTGMHGDVSVNVSFDGIAPNMCSVLSRNDGVIDIDGEYFGVIRAMDILHVIWKFEKKPDGAFQGKPVCFFDRAWEETGCGLLYTEEYASRVDLSRPRRTPDWKTAYVKPPFLDELYSGYDGVAPYSDKIDIDFDNDGVIEKVGTIIARYPSPDPSAYEMSVTFDESGKIEPTFQNARLVQFFGEEKHAPGFSDGKARISFLESKYFGVFIEDRYTPTPFSDHGPEHPFRQIYKLSGASPRVMCKSEFAWKTVYQKADAQ